MCRAHVRAAFEKLEGVSKVKIVSGEKPGTHKVLLVSKSDKLTKKQAIKALGEDAELFVVKTFGKKGEGTGEGKGKETGEGTGEKKGEGTGEGTGKKEKAS